MSEDLAIADHFSTLIEQHWEEWSELAGNGKIRKIVAAIEKLPWIHSCEPALARILVYVAAQKHKNVMEEFPRIGIETAPPLVVLRCADMVATIGATLVAGILVQGCSEHLSSKEELEMALSITNQIDKELARTVAAKLAKVDRESTVFKAYCIEKLWNSKSYDNIPGLIDSSAELQTDLGFLSILAKGFSDSPPQYHLILAEVAECDNSRIQDATMGCGLHALEHKRYIDALKLFHSLQEIGPTEIDIILTIIERCLLDTGKVDRLRSNLDLIAESVIKIAQVVALYPSEHRLRHRICFLFSPENSGVHGISVLWAAATILLQQQQTVMKIGRLPRTTCDDLLANKQADMARALDWLDKHLEQIIRKEIKFPDDLVIQPVDQFLGALENLVQSIPLSDESELDLVVRIYLLAKEMAPYGSDCNFDLELLGFALNHAARTGWAPTSRKILDSESLSAQDYSVERKAKFWFIAAEVFQHMDMGVQSLFSLVCGLSISSEKVNCYDIADACVTLWRLLRGMGLTKPARHILANLSNILPHEVLPACKRRIEFFLIQNDFEDLGRDKRLLRTRIPGVLKKVVKHAKAIEQDDLHDELIPILTMFGQLLKLSERASLKVRPSDKQLFQKLLERINKKQSLFVRVITANQPDLNDVFELSDKFEAADSIETYSTDFRVMTYVMQELLGADATLADPDLTAFTIEHLTERGMQIQFNSTKSQIVRKPNRPQSMRAMLSHFENTKLALVLAAEDGDSNLVAMSFSDGQFSLPTIQKNFRMRSLNFWCEQYPYSYWNSDESDFLESTKEFKFTALPGERLVTVFTPSIQRIPPNLLRVGNDFAGETRAVAATPSLAWLDAVNSTSRMIGRKWCAWIPSEIPGDLQTVAENITPTLKTVGFEVNTQNALPPNFRNSDISLVIAHGGTRKGEGEYFKVLKDDGDMSVSPNEFVDCLADTAVVILFVCSGGRFDKHPSAHSSMGLVKQLLNAGCFAVIASPWPVSSGVLDEWVPHFFASLESGNDILQANFLANVAVRKKHPERKHYLAMNVYGNPLLHIEDPPMKRNKKRTVPKRV